MLTNEHKYLWHNMKKALSELTNRAFNATSCASLQLANNYLASLRAFASAITSSATEFGQGA